MDIGIRAFRRSVADTFAELDRTGPIRVVNAGKRGSPAEAVLVPPDLWEQIAQLSTVKRKIAENIATAHREDHAADAA